ncbi:MAG: hypothetical protein KGJ35_00605 [Patescibacteria group bacterium]|nr:hypothetical protein [Patescibacteria group bacterium]
MNTNKYEVPMTLARMKEQAGLHEAIKSNAYYWLWKHTWIQNGPVGGPEYPLIKREVADFQRMKSTTTLLLVTFMFGMISFCVYWLSIHKDKFENGLVVIAFLCGLWLFVTALVSLPEFQMRWDIFVDTWLDANWKTKNFADEVKVIVDTCSQAVLSREERAENARLPLTWFQGNGEEINAKKVPAHVIKACQKYISDFALEVKHREAPGLRGNETRCQMISRQMLATNHRGWLKHVFGVYQRFEILQKTEKLGDYYAEAERTIAAEEAKALEEKLRLKPA